MRELKFRAWNPYKNRFEKVFTIGCDGTIVSQWGEEKYDWIIDQFTGLHDCKGREIYERDILYLDGEALKVWVDAHGVHFSGFRYDGNEFIPDHYEVAGNMHENPGLLSDTK